MEAHTSSINVAIVDDQNLFRDAIAFRINNLDNYRVSFQACNGLDLIKYLENNRAPDILLLDLQMPSPDGFETAQWITAHFPRLPIIVLSEYDSEIAILKMLQLGIRGFLNKNAPMEELKVALKAVLDTGCYYPQKVTRTLVNYTYRNGQHSVHYLPNANEVTFLQLASTEMTYKEIAEKMKVSERAIDKMRDHLFLKLQIRSRVGLVMFSVRNGLVR